ncbi:MAG TPA: helix-turn-helix domain-containing protein [Steroidobacteraceae bacterium]|nr:helix-turn-helix domain-containing protein [Steroidobacteraceae bacterium]
MRTQVRRIPDYFLYGETPQDPAERLLHVETIEARSARYHWRIDPHVHCSLHQLVLVLRGHGIARAETAVTHFQLPTLTIVPAGTVHGFEFEPGTLGFVVTLSEEPLTDASRRDPAVAELFTAPAMREFAEHASSITLVRAVRALAHEHAHAAPGRSLALDGWLAVLLACALRVCNSNSHARPTQALPPRNRELVSRFRDLIEAGFRSGRSLPDYARALHVSEARLRNACLGAGGQPPIQLLHARVLLEAKRQLIYTSLPIAEIAYGLGFDDPAYFTRFFTRRAGVCPRTYRSQGARP